MERMRHIKIIGGFMPSHIFEACKMPRLTCKSKVHALSLMDLTPQARMLS
jgi:hypothetical protein